MGLVLAAGAAARRGDRDGTPTVGRVTWTATKSVSTNRQRPSTSAGRRRTREERAQVGHPTVVDARHPLGHPDRVGPVAHGQLEVEDALAGGEGEESSQSSARVAAARSDSAIAVHQLLLPAVQHRDQERGAVAEVPVEAALVTRGWRPGPRPGRRPAPGGEGAETSRTQARAASHGSWHDSLR